MHGRQRVERSPEDEAKKQKERQAKVSAYQHAMKKIFNKRSQGEMDSEMLTITAQVLAANPDISTLWSIRKETLLGMKNLDVDNFTNNLLQKELDFSEFCLKNNPKSYGAWYQRYWLMKLSDFVKISEELRLCAKYLEYDDRNFHCWDYRRFLLDNCSLVTVDQELEFTTQKIATNFSNFSSWHLRSKLLPRLPREYLTDELDLVKNAVFTDPKDQSAWLYHLWLLKSRIITDELKLTYVHMTRSEIVIVLNNIISSPKDIGFKTSFNSTDDNINLWKNPWNSSRSRIWILDISNEKQQDREITISGQLLVPLTGKESIDLRCQTRIRKFDTYFDDETKPKAPEFEKLLRDELSWVLELHDLEPDIKWPIHTAVVLMRLINFYEFKTQITDFIDKLLQIDPKRINYYYDLLSKFKMEWILAKCCEKETDEIVLRGKHLTALYYPERLCFLKKIDIRDNQIKNCASIKAFISCEQLLMSNNRIQNIATLSNSLKQIRHLKILHLSGNPLCGNVDDFKKLQMENGNIMIH